MDKTALAHELVNIARAVCSAEEQKGAPSPREQITDAIADYIEKNDLGSFMHHTGISPDKKYRYILFGVPRSLDGEVKVYGPKFIQIRWQGALANGRGLGFQGSEIFRSVGEAMDWLAILAGKKEARTASKAKPCPSCGSDDTTFLEEHADTDMDEMVFHCNACGYEESED